MYSMNSQLNETHTDAEFFESQFGSMKGKRKEAHVFELLLAMVRKEYHMKYDTLARNIEYREKDPHGKHYVCYVDSLYLDRVSQKDFIKHRDRIEQYRTNYDYKVRTFPDGSKVLVLILKYKPMKPQVIGLTGLGNFMGRISALFNTLSSASNTVSALFKADWKPILADVTALLLHIREGFLSVPKLIACMLQLYSLHHRIIGLKPQASVAGGADLLMLLSLAHFPKNIVEMVKTFTAMTGKRLFDNDFIMGVFGTAVSLIKEVLKFISGLEKASTGTSVIAFIEAAFDFMTSSVTQYRRIKKITELYTAMKKNASESHNCVFRSEVISTYEECIGDALFADYVNNATNKDFKITWNAFVESVYKVCKNYGTSKRAEPVAFVFQGAAGSGKTTIMNTLVEYLGYKGRSTYVHTVPATESGKDFYDDYINQDVFVMDDVGQQGISQWRTLINFVSTTVFPLDCAKAEMKNTKSFNSSLILATTNRFDSLTGFTKTDCISEPNALFRRPHLIDVIGRRSADGSFYQILRYSKFDYEDPRPSWKHDFIGFCKTNDISPIFDSSQYPVDKRNIACIKWLYTVLQHVEQRTSAEGAGISINKNDFSQIDDMELFYTGQFGNLSSTLQSLSNNPICKYSHLWKEWASYYAEKMKLLSCSVVSWCTEALTSFFIGGKGNLKTTAVTIGDAVIDTLMSHLTSDTLTITAVIAITLSIIAACSYFFGYESEQDNFDIFLEACEKAQETAKKNDWTWQTGPLKIEKENSRLDSVKKHVRLIVKRDEDDPAFDSFSQCVVSGDKVLLPSHAWASSFRADIYQTVEHYKQNCKEREDIGLTLVRIYPACDLAIYQIDRCIARYPNCNNLFQTDTVSNPSLYLINSYVTIPVVLGSNCVSNDAVVKYAAFSHAKHTGYFHPLSAGGACGTILFSEVHGIVGFHVAGGEDVGFCVVPPRFVAEDIRKVMLHAEETPYTFDTVLIPNHSGGRLRYDDGFITPKRALGETRLIPTIFNEQANVDVQALKKTLIDDVIGEVTPVKVDAIRSKLPPDFKNRGAPSKLMRETAEKSFKTQGRITKDEEEFIRTCISTLIPTFSGISEEVCAFGDANITSIDKDSSNGYGCLIDKREYFDFENKVILDSAKQLFEDYRMDIENGTVDLRKSLSFEAFKDELRTEDKVNSPRTFRVMPLNHIWWTKRICGDMVYQMKMDRMKTGICVGYNPYTDSDELAKKLLACEVTGDIDFSKWDGSIMARFMYIIGDVMQEKYTGPYGKVLDYLISSMATSCVLIGDELHATTHGLPSGTWLTLVMNCLINKCLTALTLYRYKENPDIAAFHRVVDFVMGDDKVVGAAKEDSDWFNLLTIDAVATSLGMQCTNGDKTPISHKHQEFKNLTFVKRHFRQHPVLKKYVGCLSVETLLGTIQWMDKDKDVDIVLPGKLRAVQIEAYIHSPAMFKCFTNMFKKYMPFTPLFDTEQVKNILSKDDAYIETLRLMGKDYKYLE